MIEISHKQAQRWLRQKLDHHLPDAQWSTLQGHLETCAECRAYRDRLGTFERDLKRSLRSGWDSAVYHTTTDYSAGVIQRRKWLEVTRKRATWAAAVVVLGLAFILTGGFERLRNREVPQTVVETSPTVTPLPTPAAGEFRGVVAFEATVGSQSDIFLLNPGEPGGPVNLTNHPARDTSPAWSPDGEWLAFLSDRASETGQLEVFVTNVAGSRVAQLTSAPDMLWEGPISWSADGKQLALTGVRLGQGGQSRIYIVPLDSSEGTGSSLDTGAYSLPGTRGGFAPEFAPFGDRLAFVFSDGSRGGVMITHLDGRERAATQWAEDRNALPLIPGSSIEWAPDGNSLAYTAASPPESEGSEQGAAGSGSTGAQVMTVRDLNFSISLFSDFRRSFTVAQSRWPGAFRAVGWTPGGAVMYLEDLDDARADMPGAISGCWRIYTRSTDNPSQESAASLQGELCVESGLDRTSWTPDGEWLVTQGRTIAEVQAGAPRGLYAMQLAGVYGQDQEQRDFRAVRLGDTDGLVGIPRVRPALKRFQRPLNINPQPVAQQSATVQLPDTSAAPGEVLYARPQGSGSVIVRISPDGTGGSLLYATDGVARCPTFSPNGEMIAFVSGPNALSAERLAATPEPDLPASASPDFYAVDTGLPEEGLYVMNRGGAGVVRISRPPDGKRVDEPLPARYGCPAWSPDGRWLAAPVETADGWSLAVIPARGGPNRLVNIGRPAGSTGPRWTSDSSRILITHTPPGESQWPVISAVNLPRSVTAPLDRLDLRTLSGWRSVSGMAVLPEGNISEESANITADAWQIGLIAQYAGTDGSLRAVLRRLSMSTNAEREVVVLGADYPQGFSDAAPLGMGVSGSSAGQYMRSLALQRGGMLAWQAENGLGIILRGGPGTDKKTVIHFYNLDTRTLSEIAALDDVLYGAAWSPDGSWLMLSAESGLWLVDVAAAREGRAGPQWISPEPVFDLDWGK